MDITESEVIALLRSVMDPEIPVLSIVDLGIVRAVRIEESGVVIEVTPTYSGCPAIPLIEAEILTALGQAGIEGVQILRQYAPAWTTDWITERGRQRLREYGIAPPEGAEPDPLVQIRSRSLKLRCPYCDSTKTKVKSEFGSTACKGLGFCETCSQPFEYFKAI